MAGETGENGGNQGQLEALTQGENAASSAVVAADPSRAAKVGTKQAETEAMLSDLAEQMADQMEENPDQLDLMLDEDLPLFGGPVKHVADKLEQSRARGRPKGAKNKANQLFRDSLLKMGYQHPGLNLAAMANATPKKLAQELSCKPLEAMRLIKEANAELLPYFESKRPTEVVIDERKLGVMIVGEMSTQTQDDDGLIDLTAAPAPT
ncbi:hypothetical protein [Pseudovibrio sp. POLY-S9]|uniref:hypothetical protein n=1 Tax=Pseudovibrio sp. POLY-S9 TaxID=1576596 RepID=UPI00070F1C8F|nr:hypothetical protein [Pseudovibrio sp. POLY-S9]